MAATSVPSRGSATWEKSRRSKKNRRANFPPAVFLWLNLCHSIRKTVPTCAPAYSLGRWQSIYLYEGDGPRTRTVLVQLLAAEE